LRAALATPARCFVLPPDGVLIGGKNSSPFGLDVLNAGGLVLKVVTPNTSLPKTVVAIVGVPAFDRITVSLGSFFPNRMVILAALTLVSEAQAQAALGNPASPIALAARRVADDYAHNRAVRDAAEAAKQCALLARIAAEAGGDPADERFLCATCKQPFRLQGLFRHQAVCVACANCGEVCTRATLPGHLRTCLVAGTSADPLSVPAPCRTCAAALAPLRAAHAVACLFARSEYSACSRICARRLPT
jgi:ribosomal protein S27E